MEFLDRDAFFALTEDDRDAYSEMITAGAAAAEDDLALAMLFIVHGAEIAIWTLSPTEIAEATQAVPVAPTGFTITEAAIAEARNTIYDLRDRGLLTRAPPPDQAS